mgnify:CR=1 FL=1
MSATVVPFRRPPSLDDLWTRYQRALDALYAEPTDAHRTAARAAYEAWAARFLAAEDRKASA